MNANDIFRRLSSAEVDGFVLAACGDDEVPEKIAGGVLTYQSMPLSRFAKLPEETRKAYVRRTLRDKRAAELALFVLSAALLRKRASLVSTFLEACGLEHDGPNISYEGPVPEPPKKKLDAAIAAALEKGPARDAVVYLHAFASQADVSWKHLEEKLASDARLALEDRSAT